MTMILIGQFDSPFTRRVGITMRQYALAFEHRTWSIFGDADRLAEVNPLIRVPTLVLESGEALVETSAIIDYLDSRVAPGVRLTPQEQPERYRVNQVVAMASGTSDLAVRLFYEQRLHDTPSELYVKRMTRQIRQALAVLENERAALSSSFWFLDRITQADIAVTCALRHLGEAQPALYSRETYPALSQHCAQFEATDVFKEIAQAFVPPA